MEQHSYASFSNQLHTSFLVQSPELAESLSIELVEATNNSDAVQERFSLLFRGPNAPILAQQIYELRHPVLGECTLFLVPVGLNQQGALYEAIISRLLHNPLPTSQS